MGPQLAVQSPPTTPIASGSKQIVFGDHSPQSSTGQRRQRLHFSTSGELLVLLEKSSGDLAQLRYLRRSECPIPERIICRPFSKLSSKLLNVCLPAASARGNFFASIRRPRRKDSIACRAP